MSDKVWTGKTGGTRWMQLFLIKLFKIIPVRCTYPIMCLWIIGYIICVPSYRKGIYYYWRHRRGCTTIHSIWHLWLTYIEFGKAILDRFAAWAGHKVAIQIDGYDDLNKILERNVGFVVLSSHIGNQELAGYNFKMPKPMYALIYMGDTETVNAQRTAVFEQMGIRTIPYCKDGSHILTMHNVLMNGHILSIHGDRMLKGVRQLKSPIFGERASFPEGPFHIAVAENTPVITLFMMREGNEKYHLYIKLLSDGTYLGENRINQENELLSKYVQAIEETVNQYPHQWFHFYNFWSK